MFVEKFEKISKEDINIAGGKGASLGEMSQAKIPVPPGFVVLAGSFDYFLEKTDINVELQAILKKVDSEDINSVEGASKMLRDMIMDAEIPEEIRDAIKQEFKKLDAGYVAVRSSATAEDSSIASWAGELETYLNVTDVNLFDSVKKCWASLFTPRAILYRFEKGLQEENVSVAVVIQKMIQSEVSGITFTVHPITEDRNQLVVESGWGLGEAIVGGQITPDTYIFDKTNEDIIDVNVSEQNMMIVREANGIKEVSVAAKKKAEQKLTNEQIKEISKICIQIEKHYKKPQDIEWGLENGKFYILQSRPITTLGKV